MKLASEDLTAAVAHIAAGRRSVSSIALADGAIEAAIRAAPELYSDWRGAPRH